jgi:SPP1 gp7 family putative phage head morphogenesis protein
LSGKTFPSRRIGLDVLESHHPRGAVALLPRAKGMPGTIPARQAPRRSGAARAVAIRPLANPVDGISYDVLRAEMLAQLPPLTLQDFAPVVPAAILALGTIRADHAGWLAQFMVDAQADGIDLAALKVQRRKPQLNRAEKRRIGLRSETPFSRFALDMLTEKGRAAPLQALRATALHVSARQAAGAVQQRQREIGITHYVWVTGDDAQVCPACAANNGRVFAWDEPPLGGHPGMRSCCGERHCRCVAQAVFSGQEQHLAEDDLALSDQENAAVAPRRRRLDVTGVVLLAFLGLACLSLLPLLPRWL